MTNSKLLPGGFIAVTAILLGLTFATAQTTTDSAPSKGEAAIPIIRADFDGSHGKRGRDGMMGKMIEKADANGDDAVTQDEIDSFRAAQVRRSDKNNDGNISLEEFGTFDPELPQNRVEDAFQKLDEDGNGVVTPSEMDAVLGDVVKRMDRNGDGKLDRNDRDGRRDDKAPPRRG